MRSLLSTLDESVLVLAIESSEVLRIEVFSPGRTGLGTPSDLHSDLIGMQLNDAFPDWQDSRLHAALESISGGEERNPIRLSWESNGNNPRQFVANAQRVGEQIVLCAQDVTQQQADRGSMIAKAERLISAESELEGARQEILRLKSRIHRLTDNDPLTGLLDRNHFKDQLKIELRKADRYNNDLALLILSIDNLTKATDAHGPDAADQIMVAVAELLRSSCRLELDVPGRLGTDEFGIILPFTGVHAAASVATRLQRQIAHLDIWVGDALFPDDPDQNAIKVTVSAGLATIRTVSLVGKTSAAEALMNASFHALHSARRRGSNHLVWDKGNGSGNRQAS